MSTSEVQTIVQIIIYFLIFICGFVISIPLGLAGIQFDNNCLLYAHFDENGILQKVVSSNNCNFPLYMSVIGCILYGLAQACYHIYAMCRSRNMSSGTQVVILPFILTNTLITLMILVAACMISVGFKKFCDGLLRKPFYNHCSDGQGRTWHNLDTGKVFTPGNYYGMITVSQIACWIAFVLYLIQVILGITRFINNRKLAGTIPRTPQQVTTVDQTVN